MNPQVLQYFRVEPASCPQSGEIILELVKSFGNPFFKGRKIERVFNNFCFLFRFLLSFSFYTSLLPKEYGVA
jgi:hypothetical protein